MGPWKHFYFVCDRGAGIRLGRNLRDARRRITKEIGTYDAPSVVRRATEEDMAHVGAMGGWIPEIPSAEASQ